MTSPRNRKPARFASGWLSHAPCRHQRGQVLVLATIAMFCLIGFAALSVDIGFLLTTRRRMQTAADAGAIAAANALMYGEDATTAASNGVALNGFTDDANGVSVAVNNPPLAGEYAGDDQYIEVVVSQPVNTYFLAVLGYRSMTVSARAVSGTMNSPACIYTLDPSAPDAISVNGNFDINSACGIIDNSDSTTALNVNGNGTIAASAIGIAGKYQANGNVRLTPLPRTKIAPTADPLSALAPPPIGSYGAQPPTQTGSHSISGTNQSHTLSPAIYPNGISVSGANDTVIFDAGNYGNGITLNGSNYNVTFNPGQYQASSGNSVTLSGSGTTTFNDGTYTFDGPVVIDGNNTVTLSPGTYAGGITINGNATVKFSPGTYVLAGGGLKVNGNSTLRGTDVTFYDTTGVDGYQPITLSGNEQANFSAPTSGPLSGILFFQDRAVSGGAGSVINGNSNSTFDGALYFPTTSLTYNGNSSGSGYTFLIADTLSINGNSSLTIGNDYSSLSDGSPIKASTLYE
ncbi:MAG: pilus assembly protein TadG-related protein [Candidatus Binataceae bacterium]